MPGEVLMQRLQQQRWSLVLAAWLAAGCTELSPGTDRSIGDGSAPAGDDFARADPADASTGMDAGIHTGDAHRDAVDGGGVSVRQCLAPPSRPAGDACDAATRECLLNAGSSDEEWNCLYADGAPELCMRCLSDELNSCAAIGDCSNSYHDYGCCAVDRGCHDESCAAEFCADEREAYVQCAQDTECPWATPLCFRS